VRKGVAHNIRAARGAAASRRSYATNTYAPPHDLAHSTRLRKKTYALRFLRVRLLAQAQAALLTTRQHVWRILAATILSRGYGGMC